MNDAELTRVQVNAAEEYLNRTGQRYTLDLNSCRFWHKFPIKLRPWPRVRIRTI